MVTYSFIRKKGFYREKYRHQYWKVSNNSHVQLFLYIEMYCVCIVSIYHLTLDSPQLSSA